MRLTIKRRQLYLRHRLSKNGQLFVPFTELSSLMSCATQVETECVCLRNSLEQISVDKGKLLLMINELE